MQVCLCDTTHATVSMLGTMFTKHTHSKLQKHLLADAHELNKDSNHIIK